MGNLSDSMQAVVDEITASTHSRRHRLQEITHETERALNGYRSERREIAQALRDGFAADRAHRSAEEQARVDTTQQFMNEIHRSNGEQFASNEQARLEGAQQLMDEIHRIGDQRRVNVSELRSNAYNLVERFKLEHQDMADVLRKRLSSDNTSLETSVHEMVGEMASDIRQAHRIWTEGLKKNRGHEAPIAGKTLVESVAEEVKGGPEMEAAPPLSTEEEILNILTKYPEGIRLIDIGNELGIDWRTLIGPSRSLMDEGKIEKIDNLYYSKRREEGV
ncbi:MAG: hypothetical protein HY709_04200 [Candidatus Latescibacteria bacterium]|nr:hypothetical protein [Candidatus Latescibacterota bacterium]